MFNLLRSLFHYQNQMMDITQIDLKTGSIISIEPIIENSLPGSIISMQVFLNYRKITEKLN